MTMLSWLVGTSGASSVLAAWLGLDNKAEDTLAKIRWWGGVLVALIGVILYAGVMGLVLYETWGYVPWVRSLARCLVMPLRWLRDGWQTIRGEG